jgi:hypothetical protein
MVARGDLGIECPLRGTAHHPAPRRQALHHARQAGDRGHPHAGVDDREAPRPPGPRSPTWPTRCTNRPTPSCCPAKPRWASTRSSASRSWTASRGAWSAAAAPTMPTGQDGQPGRQDGQGRLRARAGSRAEALVVFTRKGSMARNAAWLRPMHSPLYAFTDNPALPQPAHPAVGHRRGDRGGCGRQAH